MKRLRRSVTCLTLVLSVVGCRGAIDQTMTSRGLRYSARPKEVDVSGTDPPNIFGRTAIPSASPIQTALPTTSPNPASDINSISQTASPAATAPTVTIQPTTPSSPTTGSPTATGAPMTSSRPSPATTLTSFPTKTSPPTVSSQPTTTPRPTQVTAQVTGPTSSPMPTTSGTSNPTQTAIPTAPTASSAPSFREVTTFSPAPTFLPVPTFSPAPTVLLSPSVPSFSPAPTVTQSPSAPTFSPAPTVTRSPVPTSSPAPTASRSPTSSPRPSLETFSPRPTSITAWSSASPALSLTSSPTTTGAPTTTRFPSPAPSASPAPTATWSPTVTPGPTTIAPTETAAPTTTPLPTRSANPSASPGPTQAPCEVNGVGFFGLTYPNSTQLDFDYDVTTVGDVTSAELTDEIIPELESAILNALLPSIATGCPQADVERRSRGTTSKTTTGFDGETGTSGVARSATGGDITVDNTVDSNDRPSPATRQGSGGAVGFSTTPTDTTLPGVACQGEEANCVVVDGAITLFGDDLGGVVNKTSTQIQILMESGAFDDVDDRIVKVRYRNMTAFEPNPVGPGDVDDAGGGVDDVPSYAWVLIAVGAAMLLALCCACPFPCGDEDDEEEEAKQNTEEVDMLTAENQPYEDPSADQDAFSVSVST